ncbi:DUF983 domain-containing protein [Paraflavitalea pollutisoli]|uniref:DUF983 domain-containing protein n=1 Tax=Paraflavitalea pollutisoli TaxID=3034143 RepID=UPI0023EB708E|nr:DUF983 domain-containing protein [Paraflavitalea sp. H1-2-19X]
MDKLNTPVSAPDVQEPKPSFFNLVRCKCPRCRKGDMFAEKNPYKLRHTMKMYDTCPVCGQPFDLEVGFYYGSSYVSYSLSIAFTAATLVAWWVLIGMSTEDNRFFWWMGINGVLLIVLQPWLMRVSRTLWLAFFVRYDKNWRTNPPARRERVNKDHMNAW